MRTYIFVAVLLLSLVARVAHARHVHFTGPHPIAAKYGGGYCYIETPHLHIYPPDHAALYQQVGDDYVFSGDPTPFGYDGDKHAYYGHHPISVVNGQPVYCYIDGPHFHAVPPPGDDYKVKDGVAFYVGPFAPAYKALKPHREKLVNAEYRPYQQFRPTVEVQPPPEWHGDVFVRGPSVEAPGVELNAPGVVVSAPGVVVNAPGVVVGAPGVFVNGPRPPGVVVGAPRVVVGAPRPPGVFVGAPGVVVDAPMVRKREHEEHWKHERDEHWEHHDNGKHGGWHK